MPIDKMLCPQCGVKTLHYETQTETFLSVMVCLICGGEQRPPGNSKVPVTPGGPSEDPGYMERFPYRECKKGDC